jgi:hypothetical protein
MNTRPKMKNIGRMIQENRSKLVYVIVWLYNSDINVFEYLEFNYPLL